MKFVLWTLGVIAGAIMALLLLTWTGYLLWMLGVIAGALMVGLGIAVAGVDSDA